MTGGAGQGRAALLAVLGLQPDAERSEITRAFRRLARSTHPDVAAGAPEEAARRFAEISDAYHRVVVEPAEESPRPAARPRRPTPRREQPWDRPPIVAGPVTIIRTRSSRPG